MFTQGHLSVSGGANTGTQVCLMSESGFLTVIWYFCDPWNSSVPQNTQWEREGGGGKKEGGTKGGRKRKICLTYRLGIL